nr:hypothetical protein Iba_chr08fCG3070 [Ipomoea batatas]
MVIHRSLLFKELATNYHSSNLASARPNLVEFGIAKEAPSRVLVYIPITAKTLNSLQSNLSGSFSCTEYYTCTVLWINLPIVTVSGNRIDI